MGPLPLTSNRGGPLERRESLQAILMTDEERADLITLGQHIEIRNGFPAEELEKIASGASWTASLKRTRYSRGQPSFSSRIYRGRVRRSVVDMLLEMRRVVSSSELEKAKGRRGAAPSRARSTLRGLTSDRRAPGGRASCQGDPHWRDSGSPMGCRHGRSAWRTVLRSGRSR